MWSAPVGDGANRTRIECDSHANRRARVQRGRSGQGRRARRRTGVRRNPDLQPVAADVAKAIKRAGVVIGEALAETDGCDLLLEDPAGAGGTLGRSFQELADLIDASGGSRRLGLCLDSCHLYASGYDVATPQGLDETLDECDRLVGLKRLRGLHFHDSLGPPGA